MDPTLPPTLGDLLTNAKKVTVSVLYWYEKLSNLLTEIFKLILKRIKNLVVFFTHYPRLAALSVGKSGNTTPWLLNFRAPTKTNTNRQPPTSPHVDQPRKASTLSGTSILS